MFVYLTTNVINGKMYVGRSTRPISQTYFGSGTLLKKAILKYGKESFEREILEVLPDSSTLLELIECEAKWIKFYNAPLDPAFYNLSWRCGGFGKGSRFSPESREKLSKSMKEKVYKNGLPQEWRENVVKALTGREPWNKGKKLSEEEKALRNAKKASRANRLFLPEEIEEIRSSYSQGVSASKLSETFGCSHHTILKIVRKEGKYSDAT